jgi:hypothetical protein
MSLARKSMVFVVAVCSVHGLMALGDQQVFDQLTVPKYVALEQGEEWLVGIVRDETTTTELEALSFFGNGTVGGVCREDNDSVTTVHLALIRRLEVKQQEYKSARYPNKEFCLVEKTHIDGTVTSGLLMPRKLVICGIEKKTKDEKCWFLGKIDQLEVRHDQANGHKTADEMAAAQVRAMEQAEQQHKAGGHGAHHKKSMHTAGKVFAQSSSQAKEKQVVVLEKQTGAMETKTIMQSLTDLIVAIIGVVKAIFECLRGLIF